MRTVTLLCESPNYTRLLMCNNQLTYSLSTIKFGLEAARGLPSGSDQPWLCWHSLNGLRTGIGRAKTTMKRRAYIDNTQSVNCSPEYKAGKAVCPEVAVHCLKDNNYRREEAKVSSDARQRLVNRSTQTTTMNGRNLDGVDNVN